MTKNSRIDYCIWEKTTGPKTILNGADYTYKQAEKALKSWRKDHSGEFSLRYRMVTTIITDWQEN